MSRSGDKKVGRRVRIIGPKNYKHLGEIGTVVAGSHRKDCLTVRIDGLKTAYVMNDRFFDMLPENKGVGEILVVDAAGQEGAGE